MPTEPTLGFEGQRVPIRPGQSVAAALTAAGIRAFRETPSGACRGMFCGMGVCQECLVEIDGAQNVRACMTKAADGQSVRRQAALAALAAPPNTPSTATPPLRRETPDVLVVGGGAGGLNAAIAAAEAGARVLVLDERRVAGGQYFKQTPQEAATLPLDAQQAQGADLHARALAAGAEIVAGAEVWGAFDGLLFLAHVDGAPLAVRPKAAIVATGAYERPLMVPGWDLPGVITTGAAQTLWRSYRTLPGRRVAICGSGPLNLQVALELARGGADVVLLAESAPPPWARMPAVASMAVRGPGLSARGAGMLARLAVRGIRPGFRTSLQRIDAAEAGLVATFNRNGASLVVAVDAVCMNAGFQPQNEILRLLGAEMDYDAAFDQLRPRRSGMMETSVTGLYAIGDCCGLGGAPAAIEEGIIAGGAAAGACGLNVDAADTRAANRRLAADRRFQRALWALYRPSANEFAEIQTDALICRCEEVTRAQIDAALADDPFDIGSVKRATRAGMGRCQGRYCGPALARHMAARTGRPVEDLSFFAPRAPIKPVAIATVLAAEAAVDES